jgi:hypothetical protein
MLLFHGTFYVRGLPVAKPFSNFNIFTDMAFERPKKLGKSHAKASQVFNPLDIKSSQLSAR